MASNRFNAEYYELLAKRIRGQDQNAFTELYNATYDRLYRYALYFLKDGHMAQDALQEIYISAYKNISMLKSDRLLYSWLRQITYHVCCDFLRKRSDISQHETSIMLENSAVLDIEDKHDGFQNIWDEDLSLHLQSWLEEMPPHPRQAFLLRYRNELRLEEIADFMDCSISSVKRYLNTAREFLRQKIMKYRG